MRYELYNGDCLEVMDKLVEQGMKVDCILTDPPYLINYSRHEKGHRFSKPIKNDDNYELLVKYIEKCSVLLKENSGMFMFASIKTFSFFEEQLKRFFKIKNVIIWDKRQRGMGDIKTTFGPQYEIIFYVTKGRVELKGKRHSDLWVSTRITGKQQLHQNQKPIDILEKAINSITDEGDVIFDGFMGSGSTGIACINTNRNFIGIELDKNYFNIAKERIENHREVSEWEFQL